MKSEIKQLIDSFDTPNLLSAMPTLTQQEKNEALHYACSKSSAITVVSILLDNGADVESIISGQRPLHVATKADGAHDIVQLLLDRDANVLARDEMVYYAQGVATTKGQSALHFAAQRNDPRSLQILIDTILKAKDTGNTDATLDPEGVNGETPLHWAARTKPTSVTLLIQHGADYLKLNHGKITPLTIAFSQIDIKHTTKAEKAQYETTKNAICNAFVDGILAKTIPHDQLIRGCLDALVALTQESMMDGLDKMLDVLQSKNLLGEILDCKDKGGVTLFHIAAANINPLIASDIKRETAVEVLLRYGADANTLADDGIYPIQRAILNVKSCPRMLEALAKVSDLHIKEQDGGGSLMHLAVARQNLDYIKILLQWDAKFRESSANSALTPLYDLEDNQGLTPLHIAASFGYMQMAQVLTDAGAEVNIQTKCSDGYTPLDYVACRGLAIQQLLFFEQQGRGDRGGCDILKALKSLGDQTKVQIASLAEQSAQDFFSMQSLVTPVQVLEKQCHAIAKMMKVIIHHISNIRAELSSNDASDMIMFLLYHGATFHAMQVEHKEEGRFDLMDEVKTMAKKFIDITIYTQLDHISNDTVKTIIHTLLIDPEAYKISPPIEVNDIEWCIEAFQWAKAHGVCHVLRYLLDMNVINHTAIVQKTLDEMKADDAHSEIQDIGVRYSLEKVRPQNAIQLFTLLNSDGLEYIDVSGLSPEGRTEALVFACAQKNYPYFLQLMLDLIYAGVNSRQVVGHSKTVAEWIMEQAPQLDKFFHPTLEEPTVELGGGLAPQE